MALLQIFVIKIIVFVSIRQILGVSVIGLIGNMKSALELSRRFIGQKCTRQLLELRNWKDTECLGMLATKGLGIGIVVGSGIVKLPQIVKMVLAGSAEGVSYLSYFLELLALTMNFCYNFKKGNSWTVYGESLLISIQNALIISIIGYYRGQVFANLVIGMVYAAVASVLLGNVDGASLNYIQTLTIPIAAASRFPQIVRLAKAKRVGQLSMVTVALTALGSIARLFTVWKEIGKDRLILASALSSAILNLVVLVQVLYLKKAEGQVPRRSKRSTKKLATKDD